MWTLQSLWRQHSKKWQISPSDYWSNWTGSCSALPLSVQSSYRYDNILRIGEVGGGGSWGIVSTLKSLQKQLQRRHKQRYLKIRRYTSPKIDVFLNGHFNASSTNRRQCAGVIFGTPGTAYPCYSLAVSPNVYTVFPPRLSFRVYLSSNNC